MENPTIMIEVVQAYIYHRTGKEVTISKRLNAFELLKLIEAYGIAVEWFRLNGKIEFKGN